MTSSVKKLISTPCWANYGVVRMSSPLVSMRGLERHYHMASGTVRALDGIDLEVSEGERIILLGPSGSGKTTLVRLMLRFHDPASGIVRLDGHDVRALTLD